MKEISAHQFFLISLSCIISTKLMSFQPILAGYAKQDAIFSLLLSFIIDLVLLYFVVKVIYKHQNTSFIELLKNKFGKFWSILIVSLICLFLLPKTLFLYQETYSFFIQLLYDDLNIFIYVIPAFILTGYLTIKGPRTLGRSLEIYAFFLAIGFLIILVESLSDFSYFTLQPYFTQGILPTLKGSFYTSFYFGNPLVLLFFVGKVKINRHFKTKTMIYNAITSCVILVLSFCFFQLYGPATKFTTFFLSDLTQFDPYVADLGRLSWLSLILTTIILFSQCSVFLYAITEGIQGIFHIKRSFFPTAGTLAVIFVLGYISHFNLAIMLRVLLYFMPYFAIGVFTVGLTITIILSCLKADPPFPHDGMQGKLLTRRKLKLLPPPPTPPQLT